MHHSLVRLDRIENVCCSELWKLVIPVNTVTGSIFCNPPLISVEDSEGGAALDILTKAVFQLSCVTETSDAELPLKQIKSLLQG